MSVPSAVSHHPTHRRDPSALAPEYVRRISRYMPGKPIAELAREFGLDERDIIKLASNENPRGPSDSVRAAIAAATEELCRYPDGNGFELKAALAERFAISPEQIVLGNGSNDVLELATQAFLRAGDHAVYSRHAFAVYPLATQARGGIGIEVPALDMGNDLRAMARAITPTTRIVFVANPNNPTGTWLPPNAIEAFIASVPEDTLVVLDEAYNEYLEPEQQAPSVRWVAKYPKLIVPRCAWATASCIPRWPTC
jgi:histidinol-phosphate aminotransferase